MAKFIPYEGYHQAQQLQEACAEWLGSVGGDLFITLNFNRRISINGARNQFKGWLGRLDRSLLGPKWHRRPSSERTFAIGVIENPDRNTHLHLILTVSPKAAQLSCSDLLTKMYINWNEIEPGGQFFSEPIDDTGGLANYITKQFTRRGRLDSCLIFSTEFHFADQRPQQAI